MYRLKANQFIDAIQWTGNNLREVQDFMAPASPLDHEKGTGLGINIYSNRQTYTDTELVFIKKDGWIVKDALGRFSVVQRPEDFNRMYELITTDRPGEADNS